jgi:2-oxoisovalerate dehydrogenase E1 component
MVSGGRATLVRASAALKGRFGGAFLWNSSPEASRRHQSTYAHHKPDVQRLPEVVSAVSFPERLDAKLQSLALSAEDAATLRAEPELVRTALSAAMATTCLHTESRIAAYSGYGYYTIGPCGEELTAALALALRPTDPAALHYRHLGALVARQLQRGAQLDAIMLDRARGYTTATTDPVTGGAHCSLGGDPNFDFLVTSTLASQGPQAVGRALAISHLPQAKWPADAISLVSCGDGSINNAEWLSAINAAEYIQHRRRACPVLFAISDNGISISLKGFGWTKKWAEQRLGMRLFHADGSSFAELLRASQEAGSYVRSSRAPATLLMSNLPRRFGHAATDRQSAYLTAVQIDEQARRDPVVDAVAAAIMAGVVPSAARAIEDFRSICELAAAAFATARAEPRDMSEEGLVARSAPSRRSRPSRHSDEKAPVDAVSGCADAPTNRAAAAVPSSALPVATRSTWMYRFGGWGFGVRGGVFGVRVCSRC